MVKNSVLLYYPSLSRRYRIVHWLAWGVLVVVNIGAFAVSLVVLLQCKPVTFPPAPSIQTLTWLICVGIEKFLVFWVVFAVRAQDQLLPGWRCIGTVRLVYASAPLNSYMYRLCHHPTAPADTRLPSAAEETEDRSHAVVRPDRIASPCVLFLLGRADLGTSGGRTV